MTSSPRRAPTLNVFPKHLGVWEGTYTRIDEQGRVLDRHESRLTCRIIDGYKWHQNNFYRWPDGRTQSIDFPGEFSEDGVLHFDTPRLRGRAWEAAPDLILLQWEYVNEPGTRLSEMIWLIAEGHRCRVWQHTLHGEYKGVTMIEERQVAKD